MNTSRASLAFCDSFSTSYCVLKLRVGQPKRSGDHPEESFLAHHPAVSPCRVHADEGLHQVGSLPPPPSPGRRTRRGAGHLWLQTNQTRGDWGGEGGGCSQPLLAAVSPSVPISWRHDAWMRGTSAIHRKIRAGSLYRKSHCGSQDVLYVCIPASRSMHSSSTTVVCIVGSSCSAISSCLSCPVLSCPVRPSVPDRATYRPKSTLLLLVTGVGEGPGPETKPPRGWCGDAP